MAKSVRSAPRPDSRLPSARLGETPHDRSAAIAAPAEITIVIPTLNERDNVPILAARLAEALEGIAWEAIFVDDDSSDGTIEAVRALSRASPQIRGLRRVHRRGLAGASLEGMLASSAPYVALIDADLQHDETRLREMLAVLRTGEVDVVVASRYLDTDETGGLSQVRHAGSRAATWFAQRLLKAPLTDPMSGFFAVRREVVDKLAPRLSDQGFKILLDILASSPEPLRVREVPYVFKPRLHGESKLDAAIVLEYLGLVVAKLTGDLVSIRFLMFGMVGASGILVIWVFLFFKFVFILCFHVESSRRPFLSKRALISYTRAILFFLQYSLLSKDTSRTSAC